jgi:glycosyltransferase involved in cell wall biosynthesis
MKVAIATTYTPFVKGGSNVLVDSLAAQLRQRGYEVDIAWLPLWTHWEALPEQTLAIRNLDLTEASGNKIDRVITVRYPSFAVDHPNKVAWFIHHHRGAYDLYGTEFQDLPNTARADKVRQMLHQSDTIYLNEHRAIYTNSKNVANRLKTFNGIEADGVLYPPLPNAENYHAGEYRDYFLYTARISNIKRQALAVEAMRYVKSPFKLVLAGQADMPSQQAALEALIERYDLSDRVQLTGWISEADKIDLTANAYACLYIAYDEDSYGYSTLEAFHSHKPIITCTDSGGTREVLLENENGLTAEPTPQALAKAMETLWSKRSRISALGENAFQTIRRHRIQWDTVIDHLMREGR